MYNFYETPHSLQWAEMTACFFFFQSSTDRLADEHECETFSRAFRTKQSPDLLPWDAKLQTHPALDWSWYHSYTTPCNISSQRLVV